MEDIQKDHEENIKFVWPIEESMQITSNSMHMDSAATYVIKSMHMDSAATYVH